MRSLILCLALCTLPALARGADEDDTCTAPSSWGEVRAAQSRELTIKVAPRPYETHVWPSPVPLERRPLEVPVLVFESSSGVIRLVALMKSKSGQCPVLATVSRTGE